MAVYVKHLDQGLQLILFLIFTIVPCCGESKYMQTGWTIKIFGRCKIAFKFDNQRIVEGEKLKG